MFLIVEFDGLDLSWHSPTKGKEGKPEDKPNFTKLCQDMKTEFVKNKLLLTTTVNYMTDIDESYEIDEVANNTDFINVIAYGLYASNHPTTSHQSPILRHEPTITRTVSQFIEESFLKKGIQADKLVYGLPMHGITSQLISSCKWDLGSKTNKTGGKAGLYTQGSGVLAHYEICSLVWKNHVCTKESAVGAPYGSTTNDFISYDDEESISKKVKEITIKHKLKGVMFWSLELDDFSGSCGSVKYPLIVSAIKTLKQIPVSSNCRNRNTCGTTSERLEPSINPGRYYRICYHTNWAQYRNGDGHYDII